MKEMVEQMYDYYIRPYLGEKGQDLIEYALLLAIVVGIGYMIYQQSGLQTSITQIWQAASNVASSAAAQSGVQNALK